MRGALRRSLRQDGGVSSVEYSLALAGVVGAVILAVMGLGDKLTDVFECFGDQLSGGSSVCATDGGEGGPTEPGPGGGTDPTGGPVEETEPVPTTTSATTSSSTTTAASTTSPTTTSPTTTPPTTTTTSTEP